MNTEEPIKNAEFYIRWIFECGSCGDSFQQTQAMQSILDVIKALLDRTEEMQCEINDLKIEINGLKIKDEN